MWPNLDFILTDNHYVYLSYKKKVRKYWKNCLTLIFYNDWTESEASFTFSSIIQNKRGS